VAFLDVPVVLVPDDDWYLLSRGHFVIGRISKEGGRALKNRSSSRDKLYLAKRPHISFAFNGCVIMVKA
jgi:hypothetical protein